MHVAQIGAQPHGQFHQPQVPQTLDAFAVSGLIKSGVRVIKLRRVDPTLDDSSEALPEVLAEEVHVIELMGALFEMYVPVSERRWSVTLTELTEVPDTYEAMRDANAAHGGFYLGFLQVIFLYTSIILFSFVRCAGG